VSTVGRWLSERMPRAEAAGGPRRGQALAAGAASLGNPLPKGFQLADDLVVGRNQDGRLEVFCRSPAGPIPTTTRTSRTSRRTSEPGWPSSRAQGCPAMT
jgi:hypothetical protein